MDNSLSISIHALREEGDLRMLLNSALISLFLSTPSARRATIAKNDIFLSFTNFYPRPPRGGRRQGAKKTNKGSAISIHALREEGDVVHVNCFEVTVISIHALREEGDPLRVP